MEIIVVKNFSAMVLWNEDLNTWKFDLDSMESFGQLPHGSVVKHYKPGGQRWSRVQIPAKAGRKLVTFTSDAKRLENFIETEIFAGECFPD